MISIRRCALILATASYIGTFCYVYVVYLNSIYGASIFPLHIRPETEFLASTIISFIPIVFYGFTKTSSSLLVILIYSLYYIPSILVTYYALDRDFSEILNLQFALMIGMCALFLFARIFPSTGENRPIPKPYLAAISGITLLLIAAVVATYRGHMEFVSFSDVYKLRYRNDAFANPLINYAVMHLTYCLLPFALARAYVGRDQRNLLLGLAGCVVIYASTGAKASILAPFMLGAFYFLLKQKGDLFTNSLLALTVTSWLVILLIPGRGAELMLKPVFFGRVLAMTGWLTSSYYDFFSSHQYTYLSQIGLINKLTGMYPYGARTLGEVFGVTIPGQSINAGFWASEGIASFGVPGIYFATALVACLFLTLNRLGRSLNWVFVEVWLCGFSIVLLNLPLSTMMVSGGGTLILIMLFALNVKWPLFGGQGVRHHEPHLQDERPI